MEAVEGPLSQLCSYFLGKKVPIFEAEEIFKVCEEGISAAALILEFTGIGIPAGAAGEIIGTIFCGAVAVADDFAGDRLCDFTAQTISELGGLGCVADCSQCPRPCIGSFCGSGETCVDGCCIESPCGDNPPCPAGLCLSGGTCVDGCCVPCGKLEGCPSGVCTEEYAICLNGCCVVPPSSSTTTTSTTTTTTSSCSTSLPATITCPSGSAQPTVVPCPCCFQNLCSQHPIQCACLCDCSS